MMSAYVQQILACLTTCDDRYHPKVSFLSSIACCIFILISTILTCVRRNIIVLSDTKEAQPVPTMSKSKANRPSSKTHSRTSQSPGSNLKAHIQNDGRKVPTGNKSSRSSQDGNQKPQQKVTGCRQRSECCYKEPLQRKRDKIQPSDVRQGPKYGYRAPNQYPQPSPDSSCRTPKYGYRLTVARKPCKAAMPPSNMCSAQPPPQPPPQDSCRTPKYGYTSLKLKRPAPCKAMPPAAPRDGFQTQPPKYGYISKPRFHDGFRSGPITGKQKQKPSSASSESDTKDNNNNRDGARLFKFNVPPKEPKGFEDAKFDEARNGEDEWDILACTILAKPSEKKKSRTPTSAGPVATVPPPPINRLKSKSDEVCHGGLGETAPSSTYVMDHLPPLPPTVIPPTPPPSPTPPPPPPAKVTPPPPPPPIPAKQPVLSVTNLPDNRIMFSGPFDKVKIHRFLMTNEGAPDQPMGWALQTRNIRRVTATPTNGVLAGQQSVLITVKCRPFQSEPNSDDRDANGLKDEMSILWGASPPGVLDFNPSWISGRILNQRKMITVTYIN